MTILMNSTNSATATRHRNRGKCDEPWYPITRFARHLLSHPRSDTVREGRESASWKNVESDRLRIGGLTGCGMEAVVERRKVRSGWRARVWDGLSADEEKADTGGEMRIGVARSCGDAREERERNKKDREILEKDRDSRKTEGEKERETKKEGETTKQRETRRGERGPCMREGQRMERG